MNLVDGKIVTSEECENILETLDKRILDILTKKQLDPFIVVEACDILSRSLDVDDYMQILIDLGLSPQFIDVYINDAKIMLSKEYIINKLNKELGEGDGKSINYKPPFYDKTVREKIVPLGVLFHIAAGNSDGLPIFTVIEGLLSGNINILKLPQEEGGLTVKILMELIRIQPLLADYIYVFDYSSKDIEVMKKLADLADAIVIWGGDRAIKSVREMASPNTRIIEWGHKMSFAYISSDKVDISDLEGIAENICQTNQLLCSSCQGIYLDTENMDELYLFCGEFLHIMEKTSKKYSADFNIGVEAQISLRRYNESLKNIFNDTEIFQNENCSITAYTDSKLETSAMFRNLWVKRLPKDKIISELRPYKNYLQTVGLICGANSFDELAQLFWTSGAVRVTGGGHMSKMYNGMAHDGDYSLRRYTKSVVYEI